MPFDWKDALSLGLQVVTALVEAAKAGRTADEAITEAQDVLERRRAIDADVDADAAPAAP